MRKYVRENWEIYRCNPIYMPFADFFGFNTLNNFRTCLSVNVKETTKPMLRPYQDGLNMLGSLSYSIQNSLRDAVDIINIEKSSLNFGLGNVVNRISNAGTAGQFLMMKIKVIFEKIIALYVTLLYTAYSIMKGLDALVRDKVVKNMYKTLDAGTKLVT